MRCSNGCPVASAALRLALLVPLVPSGLVAGAPSAQEEAAEPGAIHGVDELRPADAPALFARFARMQGLEVSFTEEKHLALLALPLRSRGKLYFLRPGHLARVVEEPSPSRLTIGPERLRMLEDGEEEVLDLRRNEELATFVSSLVRVFSGDREGLERSYRIEYALDAGDEHGWTLTLEPRGKPLDQMLRRLSLAGRGAAVLRIELVEPNGDRTVTTVLSADPERRFTAEERRELFDLAAEGGAADEAQDADGAADGAVDAGEPGGAAPGRER